MQYIYGKVAGISSIELILVQQTMVLLSCRIAMRATVLLKSLKDLLAVVNNATIKFGIRSKRITVSFL